MVMHSLVCIEDKHGVELTMSIQKQARALTNLLLSCKRMFTIYRTIAALLRREMAARAMSHIRPRDLHAPYPFTTQVEEQARSARMLRVLKEAINGMALHCADECCARSRKVVCRDLKKINQSVDLQPLERRTTLLAAGETSDGAFVCCKRRVPKKTLRHSSSHEMISFLPNKGSKRASVSLKMDTDEMSSPTSLHCNIDATKVAFIRTLHTEATDDTIPHSVLFVWSLESHDSAIVVPPMDAEAHGAINAQEVWWLADERMAVLWSTAYVHPVGSVVGASADTACYMIGVYRVEADGASEIDTSVGPFSGKAKMASPSRSGEEVALIVRKPPVGHGPGSLAIRTTILHNVFSENFCEIEHVIKSHHPHDRTICPSSIGLSPDGDCLVAVHASTINITVEVLIRTAPNIFVSVQSIGVTHWTRVAPAVEDNPPFHDYEELGHEELRLPYHVQFSPCGRFVSILDKRGLFGLPIPNHALIVLDTALRNNPRGVRALPLAPTSDVAPRSIQWTKMGLWLQAAHGAVRVCSE